jgi:hypothetical protein
MWTRLARQMLSALPLLLVGCAAPLPVPFELIDQQSVAHEGSFHVDDQRMEATIDGKRFQGFYVVATGTAVVTTDTLSSRRFRSYQSVSSVSSNSARAVLTSADGERITCEFLFADQKAVGDCRSSTGRTFQLVATGS